MWSVASTRSSSGWWSWMRTLIGPWTGLRSPCRARTHCLSWMGNRCEVLWALGPAWRTGSRWSSRPGFRWRDVHPIETRDACAGYRGGCWQRRTRPLSACRRLPRVQHWGRVLWGWVHTELRLVSVRWLRSSTLFGPPVKPKGSNVQVIGTRRLCGGGGGVKGRSFCELSCQVSFRLGAQLNRQSKAQRLGKPLRTGHKEWLRSSGKLSDHGFRVCARNTLVSNPKLRPVHWSRRQVCNS